MIRAHWQRDPGLIDSAGWRELCSASAVCGVVRHCDSRFCCCCLWACFFHALFGFLHLLVRVTLLHRSSGRQGCNYTEGLRDVLCRLVQKANRSCWRRCRSRQRNTTSVWRAVKEFVDGQRNPSFWFLVCVIFEVNCSRLKHLIKKGTWSRARQEAHLRAQAAAGSLPLLGGQHWHPCSHWAPRGAAGCPTPRPPGVLLAVSPGHGTGQRWTGGSRNRAGAALAEGGVNGRGSTFWQAEQEEFGECWRTQPEERQEICLVRPT